MTDEPKPATLRDALIQMCYREHWDLRRAAQIEEAVQPFIDAEKARAKTAIEDHAREAKASWEIREDRDSIRAEQWVLLETIAKLTAERDEQKERADAEHADAQDKALAWGEQKERADTAEDIAYQLEDQSKRIAALEKALRDVLAAIEFPASNSFPPQAAFDRGREALGDV